MRSKPIKTNRKKWEQKPIFCLAKKYSCVIFRTEFMAKITFSDWSLLNAFVFSRKNSSTRHKVNKKNCQVCSSPQDVFFYWGKITDCKKKKPAALAVNYNNNNIIVHIPYWECCICDDIVWKWLIIYYHVFMCHWLLPTLGMWRVGLMARVLSTNSGFKPFCFF